MSPDELDESMLIQRLKFDSTPAGMVPGSKMYTRRYQRQCTALFLDKEWLKRQICGSNLDLCGILGMFSMGSSMDQDGGG